MHTQRLMEDEHDIISRAILRIIIQFHSAWLYYIHCTIVHLNIDLDLETEKKRLVDS